MRIIAGVLATLLVLALGGLGYVYSGAYNVAASDEHSAVMRWLLETTFHQSVQAHADGITPPQDLADPGRIERGARAYDEMCAGCHLAPGMTPTEIHRGLRPEPPELAEHAELEPAEAFWVIKHGVKMTGMPAWGVSHEDEELWDLVAFLEQLPQLSAADYRRLSAKPASGDGHAHKH